MRLPTLHYLTDVMKLNFSNSPGEDAVEAVELRVHMDCPGCERTVRKALSRLRGIHNVEIDREQQKVTVTGFVDKDKVLNRVRRKGKLAELWPTEAELLPAEHEPDSLLEAVNPLVDYPYSYNRPLHYSYVNGGLPAYDLPPSVYTAAAVARPHGPIIDAFNEDNPNNCSIM